MVVSLAIAAAAILALTHALENIDYDEVFGWFGAPTPPS